MEEYKYLWCMMNDQLNYCARMVEERANCVTVLVSFDVISPFTNVPVDLEVKVAHEGLSAGTSMAECTVLSADQVANLLHFCLDATTLLAYKGEYYQQPMAQLWVPLIRSVKPNLSWKMWRREYCPPIHYHFLSGKGMWMTH